MSGTLDELQKRISRYKGRIENIRSELDRWKLPRPGKMASLTLPEDIRSRLSKQCVIWGAMTLKQMVGTCITLGLQQMEELGRLVEVEKETKHLPPKDKTQEFSKRHEIAAFVERMKTDFPGEDK